MAITKDVNRVRVNGGNDAQVYYSGGWKSLGNILTATLEDITDSAEITFADGDSVDIDGKRKVKVMITLAQTTKEELDLVDTLRYGKYAMQLDCGEIVTGGTRKRQYLYIPAFNFIPKLSFKMPDSPMQFVMEGTAEKQATPVSVIVGTTSLPGNIEDTAPITYTSLNNYYLIYEQTIS